MGLVGHQGFPLVGSLYPQGVVSNQGLDQCLVGLVECLEYQGIFRENAQTGNVTIRVFSGNMSTMGMLLL